MKLSVVVARIYGTDDQYGAEPRMRPSGAPLVFDAIPDPASRAHIDFGPVPDEIAEAERGRRALGRVMLNGVFGGANADGTPDDRFEAALRELGGEPAFTEFNWYATLTVTSEVEVSDDLIEPVGFVFPRNAFDLADEAQASARDSLDALTAIASSVSDPQVFSHLVLEDRVLLFAPGKRATGVPVLSGSAKGSVTRGAESLAKLERRLVLLQGIDARAATKEPWLARVAHWRAQVLVETDPWKRFMWSFLALEILTNKLFDQFESEVVTRLRLAGDRGVEKAELPLSELVWPAERAPLIARFALVAVALFSETAVEDVANFRALKKARDRLSHGSLRDEGELPVSVALELLEKYLTGSVKRLVLGFAADEDWGLRPAEPFPSAVKATGLHVEGFGIAELRVGVPAFLGQRPMPLLFDEPPRFDRADCGEANDLPVAPDARVALIEASLKRSRGEQSARPP